MKRREDATRVKLCMDIKDWQEVKHEEIWNGKCEGQETTAKKSDGSLVKVQHRMREIRMGKRKDNLKVRGSSFSVHMKI